MTPDPDLAYALTQDRADPLARFQRAFVNADPDTIYLDGNSLGRLPRATPNRLRQAVEREWGAQLVRGWNEGWMDAPRRVGAKIAELIGVEPDEVVVADSTSVNFFKLASAALDARPGRHQILTEADNFPTDAYVLQGLLRARGAPYRLDYVEPHGLAVETADVVNAIEPDACALVTLSHTSFKSGAVYDMAAVTRAAHERGALVLWDLSHSVGALPLDLKASDADLAVGCTYKYLNGGPGAPAFLYVRRDLQERLQNPIQGWFGQRDQFDMRPAYTPAPGIDRFLVGTPPVLSLLAVEVGVDLVLEAGIEAIRAKSIALSEFFIALWERELAPLGLALHSPRDPARRGSHVSLGHPEGLRIARALIEDVKVIPDFRPPDNLRFGFAPLYTNMAQVREAVVRLRRVLVERLYENYSREHPRVT